MDPNRPIVFVTAYLGGTHGTAKSARDFFRALLASSDNVKVVSLYREEYPLQLCGVRLSSPEWLTPPVRVSLPVRPWKLRIRVIISWLKYKKQRRDFTRSTESALVFVNGWASCDYWQTIEEYFRGTKVLIIRESPRHFAGPDRDKSMSEMIDTFSRFDHLLFVSDRVRLEWLQNITLSKMKGYVLPNCCEEEDATACLALNKYMLRLEYGFTANDFIVFCPGNIEYRKGQDLLHRIIPKLRQVIPNLKILFVGDAETLWSKTFLSSIVEDDSDGIVKHMYAQPDIFALLHMADVLAFPSRAEALPRTILEAMVMKIPVVATSVDGVPELIENGCTGILFGCDDSEGLFNGILSLYLNPIAGAEMAESANYRYWSNFSRIHQFNRMKAVLCDLDALNCHKT